MSKCSLSIPIIALFIALSSHSTAQVSTYLGLDFSSIYFKDRTAFSQLGFKDHVGLGGEITFRTFFGNDENLGFSIHGGYYQRSIQGVINLGEAFQGSASKLPINETEHYMVNELTFDYQPINLQENRFILSIGTMALTLFDKGYRNGRNTALGPKMAVAYEVSMGRSGLALRGATSFTYFIDHLLYESITQLNVGLIWNMQLKGKRGLY